MFYKNQVCQLGFLPILLTMFLLKSIYATKIRFFFKLCNNF
jgi:hypothetical protein